MSRDIRGACALYYSYQVRGVDGRIKVPFRRRTAHSFLKAYVTFLYVKFGRATAQSTNDTANVSRSIAHDEKMTTTAAAAGSTVGLVVGTGTTAVAFTDVALVTQIAHGSSASQLQYGASVVNNPSSDGTSTSMIMTRDFSNASGGSITVREIGIYSQISSGNRIFCTVRDLATIVLADGDVLTLNYIFKTTA